MSLPEVQKPRVPMAQAAHLLAELCDRLEEGEEPGAAFVAVFNETRLELAEAIDRRIAFDKWIDSAINAANSARDQWADRSRKLRAAREAFERNTRAILMENPDLPYKGSIGSLALQKNGNGKTLFTFGEKELTPELIEFYGIEDRFVRVKTTYEIDTTAVKAALKAGEQIDWASIDATPRLKIGAMK